jgi:hypothetical protein
VRRAPGGLSGTGPGPSAAGRPISEHGRELTTETPTTSGTSTLEAQREPARRPVTLRAVLLGLLFALALAAITPTNDFALGNTFIAGNHFPLGAFIVLFVLAVPVNFLLRWLRRARPLRAGELVTIWCMIVVSSGIPSSGLMRLLVPVPVGLSYFANNTNNWDDYVVPNLPSWLYIEKGDAADWFFEGKPDNKPIPWAAWRGPTIAYGILTFLFYLATAALAALMRRQWEENERFTFPLVEMPLELVAASESPGGARFFLGKGAFWGTVVVVVALHSLNGMNRSHPSLPQFPFHADLSPYLTEPPWRYVGWMVLNTYPMMVGIAFFARTEVTFSIWFFYLVRRIQEAVNYYLGLPPGPALFGWGPNFIMFQQMGAYIGLLAWTLWAGRHHISRVFAHVLGRRPMDDRNEPLAYRVALPLLVVGLVGCVVWLKVAGVTIIPAVVCILGLFGVCIVMAWLINNGGTIFVQNRFSPSDYLTGLLGTKGPVATTLFTPSTLAVVPLFETIYARDLREIILPSLLNSFRAATPHVNRRQLLYALGLSIAAVTALSYYMAVRVGYVWAAGVLPDTWAYQVSTLTPYDHATRMISDGVTFEDHANLRNLGIGAALVLGLSFFRSTFMRGIHPAGFCLSATYAGDQIWFSMFLAWGLKTLLLRYGGYRAMQSARPFIYGLVIGDAIAAVIWIIVGWHIANPDMRYYILPP